MERIDKKEEVKSLISIEYIVKKTKEKKVGAYCIRLDSVERIELVSWVVGYTVNWLGEQESESRIQKTEMLLR